MLPAHGLTLQQQQQQQTCHVDACCAVTRDPCCFKQAGSAERPLHSEVTAGYSRHAWQVEGVLTLTAPHTPVSRVKVALLMSSRESTCARTAKHCCTLFTNWTLLACRTACAGNSRQVTNNGVTGLD